jgi:hypothetical protein
VDLTKEMKASADRLAALVMGDKFLQVSYSPILGEAVIFDRDLAWLYASSQDLPDWYDYWTHILESKQIFSSEVAVASRWSADEAQALWVAADEVFKPLAGKISEIVAEKNLPAGFVDLISNDLHGWLLYEFWLPAGGGSFWQNFLRIYSHGGMPCGWKGKYPEGELLIYTQWP